MDDWLSKVIIEAIAAKDDHICKLCYSAKEILGDKNSLLKSAVCEIRDKCLCVIKHCFHSKSQKLRCLAVIGCQQLLRDDLFWICDTSDEQRLLPMQLCATVEAVIASQTENVKIDVMKVLLEMACRGNSLITSNTIISIVNICLQVISSSESSSLSIATQATASQVVQCYVKYLIADIKCADKESYFENNLLPLVSFICQKISENRKSTKIGSSSSSVNSDNCNVPVISLLLKCIHSIFVPLESDNSIINEAFVTFIWQTWCPLQIKLLSSGITKIKSDRKRNVHNDTLDAQSFGRGSESFKLSTNDKVSALKEMFSIAKELVRLFGTQSSMRTVLEALFHRMLLYRPINCRLETLKAVKEMFADCEIVVKFCFLNKEQDSEIIFNLFNIFMDSVKECSYSDDQNIVNQSVLCIVALLKTFENIVNGNGLDERSVASIVKWSETDEFASKYIDTDRDNFSILEEQHNSFKTRSESSLMRKDFKDFQINSYKTKLEEILESSSSLSSSTSSLSSVSGNHNNDNDSSDKRSHVSISEECKVSDADFMKDVNPVDYSEVFSSKIKSFFNGSNICNDEIILERENFSDEDIVAQIERENARKFFFDLKNRIPHFLTLRTIVEIDDEFQKFASNFCKDVWDDQTRASTTDKCNQRESHFIIINGDGLYLAIYSGLILNSRLLSLKYYDCPEKAQIPLTEEEFINQIQKSGVLVYLSATWLREFYQMILSENLLDFPECAKRENVALLNLLSDIGGQYDSHKMSHELSHFKKMVHSSGHFAVNDSPKVQAGKLLVKYLLRRFWSSISTIFSSLFVNDIDVNSTQSLLTVILSDNQKDCIEKRDTLIQCLEALQITSRICITLGLQSKCNGIFDMLTKSIVNPFVDENGKTKMIENDTLTCLHSSQVLSLQSILSSALEVAGHCPPCWEFVFICCNYVINLEYLHFSKKNVVKESKLTLTSVLKLKKEVKDDFGATFSELQPVNSLLGPNTEKDIIDCLNEVIQSNGQNNSTNDKLLRGRNFDRSVECLSYLVEKLFTDAASTLNLESLLGFLKALISNSSRELHLKSRNTSIPKQVLLFNRFCDAMLKISRSGRPLIHIMKCWSVAYPHFVEAACYKEDISVCKTSVSTINDIVTISLSTYTELPFFHFNEALFKPYENLLLLELCETDIQEMIISSICGFVEGFSEELKSGWRSLFAALRGIRLPNVPFGNHAYDAYELEMERVRQLRVILDIFEAFLGKNNLEIFANAAVDCLLCLLQLLKDPTADDTQDSNKILKTAAIENHYSVDLCLLSLKYLHQFESLLRSMYRMPACPMFTCTRSMSTCSEPKIIEIPAFCVKELNFKVPLLLYDIDRAVKILHVWYLLLDGLINSITTCPQQHQTKTIEMSLALLGTLRQIPGKEFAVYCINHIALPLLQRWSRSLTHELNSVTQLNNFKHYCGLLSHLVAEHLKLTSLTETDIGLELMFLQTLTIFIELSGEGKPWVVSNLSLACVRHIIIESYKYMSKSMWTSLCSILRISSNLFLKSINDIIDAFPNKTIHFYDDLCNVRVITKRQTAKLSEEPELIVRGCVQQVFLLDSQRLLSNDMKKEEGDNRCFLLQISQEDETIDILFCRLVRELLSHLTVITMMSEILVRDLPHSLPNVSSFKSKPTNEVPFLSTLNIEHVNEILQLFSDCAVTYHEFDTRPGLKFLIQKISNMAVPANLYQQSALCFSVQFLIYFYYCTQSCNSQLDLKLRSLFEKICEDYTDFIMQAERSDSRLDELCQKPVFFLPQIVELTDIISNSESTSQVMANQNSEETDFKIYKIVDEKRIEELTNEYKKWKCQHSPIPPVFTEKVMRKKELPKRFYSSETISAVEKANEVCLMRDTEAYLCLWTQILQSVIELHIALPPPIFERMIPVLEPGVELLVMYASSKELKSLLTVWIRNVALK